MFYLSFFRFERSCFIWKKLVIVLGVGLCVATSNMVSADTAERSTEPQVAVETIPVDMARNEASSKRSFKKKTPMTRVEAVSTVQQNSFFSSDAVEVLVVESFAVPSSKDAIHRSTRLTRLPMNAAVASQVVSGNEKNTGNTSVTTAVSAGDGIPSEDGTMPLIPPLPPLPELPSALDATEPATDSDDATPDVETADTDSDEVQDILDPGILPSSNPETVPIPSVSDSLSGPKVVMIPPAVETVDDTVAQPAEEVGDHLWSGIVSDERRRVLEPVDGVIRTSDAFELLWKYWGGTTPKPDFDPQTQLVLVATVNGPNQTLGVPVLGDHGRVEFAVGGTLMAGPGFGWRMAILPKMGIQQLNGRAFSETPAEWVCGDILIPKELPAIQNATLVITLFRTNVRRPSLPAERVDQIEISDVSHTPWKNERICFGVGVENTLKTAATYYVTVSLKQNDQRTHEGLYEGQKMAKVLTEKSPSSVQFVIQPIQ